MRFVKMIARSGAALLVAIATGAQAQSPAETVYIGTQGEVLLAGRLDTVSGDFTLTGPAAQISRPTWVTVDAPHRHLFTVSEVGNYDKQPGLVASYAIDPTSGALTPISKVRSGGGGPTYLAADAGAKALFVAHFGGGAVTVLPLASDGALGDPLSSVTDTGKGPDPARQTFAHAHETVLAPGGHFLLVPDMGADRIFIYRFDPQTRQLAANPQRFWQAEPGTGPRHLAFGHSGRFVYCVTELSAEVRVLRWDAATGQLHQVQAVTMDPPGSLGKEQASAAEIALGADGRFLYVSDRTRSTMQVYAVDHAGGRIRLVQDIPSGGVYPRSFAIAPGGRWLIAGNQRSRQIQVFAIDPAKGTLLPHGAPVATPEMPVSFAFFPG